MSQAATAQAVPTTSALPVGVPGASITPKFQVRVRFRRRMAVQRVYSMVVELRPEKGGASSVSAGDSVIARPIIPGAHVQPPEQELGPKASNSQITFAVTPLAAGRLKGARLQIMHQGRVLEEVWTPMRGIRPGRILLWTGLMLLSIAYLFGILGPLPNLSTGETADPNVDRKVDGAVRRGLPDYLEKAQVEQNCPEALHPYLSKEAISAACQDAYNYLYAVPNLNFYLTSALLLVLLVSVFFNRPSLWRSTRKGKPLLLPSLPDGSGNPLAFSTR
jgi:hypothetical protein